MSETDNRTEGKSGSVRDCRCDMLSSRGTTAAWSGRGQMATEAQTQRPKYPTRQASNQPAKEATLCSNCPTL